MKAVMMLLLGVVVVRGAPQAPTTVSGPEFDDQVTEASVLDQDSESGRQFNDQEREEAASERQFDAQEAPLPPQPYAFRFNIDDEIRGVRFAHLGQGDDQGRVQGSYTYLRPDGVLQTVRYLADETGFHPEIVEEPSTNLEVNPAGSSRFSVLLPYAEEYGVEVTADQLQQYVQQAQKRGASVPAA